MKLIYFVLLFIGVCSACYDNKGSSDYVEKLDIRVENIDESINVSVASVLELHPKIYPEDREYECFWGIANVNNQYGVIDTLSKERDLNVQINLKTGSYLLRFCAKDLKTGIFSYTEYKLSVQTDMSIGWWVLKDGVNGADIDLFAPDRKIENVIYARNGKALAGKALDMSYTNYYRVYDPVTSTDELTKAVFVGSSEDLVVMDFFTGRIIRNFEELFYETPKHQTVQALFRGASDTHVIVDNQLYTMPNMRYSSYRQFAIQHQGDYKISSYRNATGWSNPLLFDELTSSFCTVTRNSLDLNFLGNDITPAPHKNLDMDLLFLGARTLSTDYLGAYAFAILKKKNEASYKLAYLSGTPAVDKNPMQEQLKDLPNTLGVLHADFRAMNQDNDIIYFSKDNKIFSCNLVTFEEREQDLNFATTGERITYTEYVKYAPWDANNDWFTYLVIATMQGEHYKLYLHPVQAGVIQPAIKTFEGEGQVKKAIYMKMDGGYVNTSTFF